LEPRDANRRKTDIGYEAMVSEVQAGLDNEVLEQGGVMSQHHKQITLTASIAETNEPRLIRIVRLSGKFGLSVFLNGKQL
jgi:hypothetical protein